MSFEYKNVSSYLLKEMSDNLKCIQCTQPNRKLASINCGHLFCEQCVRSALSKKKTKCPVCFKVIDLTNVKFDDVIEQLREKTILLEENINRLNVCDLENPIGEVRKIDQYSQTVVAKCDVEVQADLTRKVTHSVATQTESHHNHHHQHHRCCIGDNLKKILSLNICDSLNVLIEGLLTADQPPPPPLCQSNSSSDDNKIVTNHPTIELIDDKINQPDEEGKKIKEEEKKEQPLNDNLAKNDVQIETKPLECVSAQDGKAPDEISDSVVASNHTTTISQMRTRARKQENESTAHSVNDDEFGVKNGEEIFLKPKTKPKSRKRGMKAIVIDEEEVGFVASRSKRTNSQLCDEKTSEQEKRNQSKQVPKTEQTIQSKVESINECNDTPSSTRSRRSRSRSSSAERPKYVLMCSGLDVLQKRKLENASQSLNFVIVNEWRAEISHLVVNRAKNTLKREMLSIRSIKYLMALLGNKWIVSFDWITASVNSNRMVDEAKYEIKGVRNCIELGCPQKSRLEKKKFFTNYAVLFVHPLEPFPVDVKDVEALVRIGGGEVVNDELELLKADVRYRLIVTDNVCHLRSTTKIRALSINQFLDAMTNLQHNDLVVQEPIDC